MAKNVTYRLRLLIVAMLVAVSANAQQLGLKTNLLYWATTTPNVGLELQTGRKHSVQAFYGINPWKFNDNKSIRHWMVQPEYRYWFCQTFNGWFLGVHAMGGQFNAGGIELPFGMFKEFKDHRYEGWFVGGGLTAVTLTDFTLHFSCCFTNLLHSHFVPLLNNFTMQEKCY